MQSEAEPVVTLLPCPFCGSDGDMLRICDTRPAGTCWVSCDICETEGPASSVGKDPAGAAEAWNTRHREAAVAEAVAKEREACARIYPPQSETHAYQMAGYGDGWADCLRAFKAAIRARTNTGDQS
jgi:Lar family restriction alleviation protein